MNIEFTKEPMILISKFYNFEAAHFLPNVPPGHPCGTMHGHSYSVWVELGAPLSEIDSNQGWFMDYNDLNKIMNPIIQKLDHCTLNNIPQLTNPTAEHIALWICSELRSTDAAKYVTNVVVKETEKTSARVSLQ